MNDRIRYERALRRPGLLDRAREIVRRLRERFTPPEEIERYRRDVEAQGSLSSVDRKARLQ